MVGRTLQPSLLSLLEFSFFFTLIALFGLLDIADFTVGVQPARIPPVQMEFAKGFRLFTLATSF